MEILIAGDLVPINSNESIFIDGDLKNHFSDFEATFNSADLFIANLECPLTVNDKQINKSGSAIKADPKTIAGITNLNIKLASLANNHIGDYGEIGVRDTLKTLKDHKIDKIGAGTSFSDAKEYYIYEKEGDKVGVLSFADYEFGMVTSDKAGAYPFSFINAYNDLIALKSKVDYIITLLHDGKEYYQYPSPDLQQVCRHLVNIGSDIVVCQHSHVIGTVEKYKSGTIVYGQGNFLFDFRNNRTEEWSRGFFIKLKLSKNNSTIDLLPFKQNYPGVSKLNKEEEDLFKQTMDYRSKNAINESFINESWKNFIISQKANYLSVAFGHNLFFSRIFKKIAFHDYLVSNKVALIVLNFLRSRVHRESFISILEEKTKNQT